MVEFRYSPSAINCYNWCPRKFKLQYIDKISSKSKSKALVDGSALHSYFELFYKTMPALEDVSQQHFINYKNSLPAEIKEQYKTDINNFLEFNQRVFIGGGTGFFKPLAIEEKVYDKDLNFVGVIDCAFTDGKNVLILDFKTGKPKDKIPEDYLFQLSAYIHLWNIFKPELPATHVGILYTKGAIGPANPVIIEVNKTLLDNMFKIIVGVKNKVENAEFPKCDSNFKCRICELADNCFGIEDLEKLQSEIGNNGFFN